MLGHLLCEGAKVDVRARLDNGRRHFLVSGPLLHGVWNPALDLVEILGVTHLFEEMVGRHLIEPELEFLNRRLGDDGAVLGLVDKRFGVFDGPFLDQVRPELLGHIELSVNLHRLFD